MRLNLSSARLRRIDPSYSLYLAWFAENLKSPFFVIKRNDAGKVVMDVAYKTDGKLPVIAAADIGKWALAAFKDPEQWAGEFEASFAF